VTGDDLLRAFRRAAALERRRILRGRPARRRQLLRIARKVTGR